MKAGDTVKCNTEGLIGFTKDFLYKVVDVVDVEPNSSFLDISDDTGVAVLCRKRDFDLYKPSKTGWQQMQEAAGVKVNFITPTCDFGCKYAFGNEHLEGCSLTGEIK